MPGKKNKKAAKKKKVDGAGREGGTPKPSEPPKESNKEIRLKKELDDLDQELSSLKKQVKDLVNTTRREENEWMQKEAELTKQETDDYQSYLSRKADKHQSLIISLNDYNHKQLMEIAAEKDQLLKDYEEKKAGLSATLLEKENELSKIQEKLASLEPFKTKQQEQERQVQELERSMEEQKFSHENSITAIKIHFIRDKRAAENDTDVMIKEKASEINKWSKLHLANKQLEQDITPLAKYKRQQGMDQQATEYMENHTQKIKLENKVLRHELQDLIELTSSLQRQKTRLEKQFKTLKHEYQFSHELNWLRVPVFRGVGEVKDLEPYG